MNPHEFNVFLERLRSGEKVECPHCKGGVMVSVGDCKTTKCFYCDKCKTKLNIN